MSTIGQGNDHDGLWACVWGALALFAATLSWLQDPTWIVSALCYSWMSGACCMKAWQAYNRSFIDRAQEE